MANNIDLLMLLQYLKSTFLFIFLVDYDCTVQECVGGTCSSGSCTCGASEYGPACEMATGKRLTMFTKSSIAFHNLKVKVTVRKFKM